MTAKGTDRTAENRAAAAAAESASEREAFLAAHQGHVRRLVSTITGRIVTTSDDEWIIAMSAVNEALDRYTEDQGDFWPFAVLVIKSRVTDHYRKLPTYSEEVPVRPEVFEGGWPDDGTERPEDMETAGKLYGEDACASQTDTEEGLREEIEELAGELSGYGFSFFDLAGCSPGRTFSRQSCGKALRSIFLPPPLVEKLRKTGILPAREIRKRSGVSQKILDKHRKYLIAAVLILSGDYPGLAEYLKPVMKLGEEEEVKE